MPLSFIWRLDLLLCRLRRRLIEFLECKSCVFSIDVRRTGWNFASDWIISAKTNKPNSKFLDGRNVVYYEIELRLPKSLTIMLEQQLAGDSHLASEHLFLQCVTARLKAHTDGGGAWWGKLMWFVTEENCADGLERWWLVLMFWHVHSFIMMMSVMLKFLKGIMKRLIYPAALCNAA